MAESLKSYFARVNPTLRRPEEGSSLYRDTDFYGAVERMQRAWFVTGNNTLDRTRANRNRFVQVVR